MTSTPESESSQAADERLLAAHDLALAALHEITPATTVGPAAGYTLEEGGVVSLRFENTMLGYPGWFWTVSVAVVEGSEPTVLEAELLPGDGALLAPEWVPWAVRLAEYQSAQAALAAEERELAAAEGDDLDEDDDDANDAEDDEDDEDDDLDDLDDLDAADFDEDGSPILHAGDLDGVDIDVLDDGDDDSDADDDDSDTDDDVADEDLDDVTDDEDE
ncbi:MAG: DNA primase [Microbacterium sp. SCN 70-27]|uniref:DUF3027 domain-containing protein n=1 Tax=unclassified Microbacterium TaxID=2609290 RepID=UPI000868AA35|nr:MULTISPECIES: DUF3027 domain-containing protein [unclassified Microbacterium]MBN9224148.1 DUF3027 domain-containing protein [Microbacterium sp.]ODT26670.1 MAG: DNA primase [Microbacterium sp. SCN 70-27]